MALLQASYPLASAGSMDLLRDRKVSAGRRLKDEAGRCPEDGARAPTTEDPRHRRSGLEKLADRGDISMPVVDRQAMTMRGVRYGPL